MVAEPLTQAALRKRAESQAALLDGATRVRQMDQLLQDTRVQEETARLSVASHCVGTASAASLVTTATSLSGITASASSKPLAPHRSPSGNIPAVWYVEGEGQPCIQNRNMTYETEMRLKEKGAQERQWQADKTRREQQRQARIKEEKMARENRAVDAAMAQEERDRLRESAKQRRFWDIEERRQSAERRASMRERQTQEDKAAIQAWHTRPVARVQPEIWTKVPTKEHEVEMRMRRIQAISKKEAQLLDLKQQNEFDRQARHSEQNGTHEEYVAALEHLRNEKEQRRQQEQVKRAMEKEVRIEKIEMRQTERERRRREEELAAVEEYRERDRKLYYTQTADSYYKEQALVVKGERERFLRASKDARLQQLEASKKQTEYDRHALEARLQKQREQKERLAKEAKMRRERDIELKRIKAEAEQLDREDRKRRENGMPVERIGRLSHSPVSLMRLLNNSGVASPTYGGAASPRSSHGGAASPRRGGAASPRQGGATSPRNGGAASPRCPASSSAITRQRSPRGASTGTSLSTAARAATVATARSGQANAAEVRPSPPPAPVIEHQKSFLEKLSDTVNDVTHKVEGMMQMHDPEPVQPGTEPSAAESKVQQRLMAAGLPHQTADHEAGVHRQTVSARSSTSAGQPHDTHRGPIAAAPMYAGPSAFVPPSRRAR
eukprot:gnl/TRDRNA2_/TRDRNA2_94081_c0_seq1.p1 gnl/TRDRNA2_/TRDRNA2_94081_c0~~gnl/TRDRNA2_/TRDRNA2_94081_c0_seq1.p1  ORF type:complete len:688 (-),score=128.54 gnl/TRDRNA2_/TRDRNA2_94081_c0_seq1:43-2052(-)